MKLIGLSGWSGSGKTTLLVRLIPELTGRGLCVSTIKHAHHGFDVDQRGKDSHAHRTAGAKQVMVASAHRWALMHEHRGGPEPGLSDLVRKMSPVDLLLVEGFKHDRHDKIEVYRRDVGKPLQACEDPHIVAVASDGPVPETNLPVFRLDDVGAVADFVLEHCGLTGLAGAA